MNEKIIFHLQDYFGTKDYKLKKTSDEIIFRKKFVNGFQEIGISSSNYYPRHYLSWGYGMRIDEIEKVMVELEKCFRPNFFYLQKDSLTYVFSPRLMFKDIDYEQKIEKERDVIEAVNAIKEFTEKYAFPLFDFLSDIKKVDNEINGNGDNFWSDDEKKKFRIHRFDVRRIVIAKLVKTPEEYKRFTEKLMEEEDKQIELLRQSDEKNKDLKNWFVPKILGHLEEIVK